MRDSLEELK
jgi:hypothetical protein